VGEAKKILVTGAKGMLGRSFCKTMKREYEVRGISRDNCDITQREETEKVIGNFSPDVVIHCAAYTNVDGAEENYKEAFLVNVEGTRNVLSSLKTKDYLFVYISTDYVFDGNKKDCYNEQDIPHPLNQYGASKLEGERIVSKQEKHLILRTSWLFGPGGKNFVTTIIEQAKREKIIRVVNDQVGSPTYTEDLAKAIKDIIDIYFNRGLDSGIFHITNSGKCTWFEFAQYIAMLMNSKVKIEPITSQQLPRKARRPFNSLLSNEKFFNLTGYKLRCWKEAVKEYIKKRAVC
jgi:dTDP-4-dehydrorhamnose reductase